MPLPSSHLAPPGVCHACQAPNHSTQSNPVEDDDDEIDMTKTQTQRGGAGRLPKRMDSVDSGEDEEDEDDDGGGGGGFGLGICGGTSMARTGTQDMSVTQVLLP